MRPYVYDAAVLIAAGRNDRKSWAAHVARVGQGDLPMVPATVVAQVSRDRRRQVQLGRFLATCTVVPLSEEDAHEAGRLAGRAGTSDVVDASLVVLALRTRAIIVTGDKQDIERLVVAGGGEVPIVDA